MGHATAANAPFRVTKAGVLTATSATITGDITATSGTFSGTVNASYLTIKDINAIGGATWNAFTTSNNVDGGNNSGWDFNQLQIGLYIYTRRKNKRILS